jgi:hypothetical protein
MSGALREMRPKHWEHVRPQYAGRVNPDESSGGMHDIHSVAGRGRLNPGWNVAISREAERALLFALRRCPSALLEVVLMMASAVSVGIFLGTLLIGQPAVGFLILGSGGLLASVIGASLKRKRRHAYVREIAREFSSQYEQRSTEVGVGSRVSVVWRGRSVSLGSDDDFNGAHFYKQILLFGAASSVLLSLASLPIWLVFGIAFINPLLAALVIVASLTYVGMFVVGGRHLRRRESFERDQA